MEIIFFETQIAIPPKQRNVMVVAIKKKNIKDWYLVNCCEGTKHKILFINLTLINLQAIFITQIHKDNCYGLPGLFVSAQKAGRKDKLTIIGPKGIEQFVSAILTTIQMKLAFKIEYIEIQNIQKTIELNEFYISITELSHKKNIFTYNFTEKKNKEKLARKYLIRKGIKPGYAWVKLEKRQFVELDKEQQFLSFDYIPIPKKIRSIVLCGDSINPEQITKIKPIPNIIVLESSYEVENILQKVKNSQSSYTKITAEYANNIEAGNLILTHWCLPNNKHKSKKKQLWDRCINYLSRKKNYLSNDDSVLISIIEKKFKKYYSGNLIFISDFEIVSLDKYGAIEEIALLVPKRQSVF